MPLTFCYSRPVYHFGTLGHWDISDICPFVKCPIYKRDTDKDIGTGIYNIYPCHLVLSLSLVSRMARDIVKPLPRNLSKCPNGWRSVTFCNCFKLIALSPTERKCHYPRNLSQPRARGFRLSSRARGLAFRCPARLRGSCAARVVVVRFRVFRVGALLLGCRVVVWALVLARNCEKLPLGFVVGLFPLFFAVS